MYQNFKTKIEEYNTIIIHRHSRPDGDALGSQMGLKKALKLNYPEKQIYAVGDTSKRLSFIGEVDEISDDVYDGALCIILDSAELHLVSDSRYEKADYLIKIDHHIPRGKFAPLEYVDTTYESCAGLVANILMELGYQLNSEAAASLFTGIVTDSGRFRYSSTTSKTFDIVSKLMKYNFDFISIYDKLYIEDIKIVKLKAACTLNFQLTKSNVAYLKNTAEDLKKYDVDFFTMSRGMVGTMAGIDGIEAWVNFTEDPVNNCVIAELRSNSININQIAVKYGGGGHLNASGATLKDFDEADKMLEDLNLLVEGKYGN